MTRLQLATRETFASFSNRNFRLFFGGQIISQVGNWLTLIAQALLALRIGGTGVAVGLLTAFQFAPVLVLGAWGGLVADRSDKRKLLVVVQVFAMVQSFALAAFAFSGSEALWVLYLIALAGGISMAFDNPARRSLVVEMVDESQVANAVSLNSALMTSSRVVGPALAGVLIGTVGYGWCFVVDGLSYVAVLVAYALMNPAEFRPGPVVERGKGQVRAGLRYVAGVPELRIPLVMMTIVGTLAFNFSVVFPLFIRTTFGGADWVYTALFSVVGLGSLVGALAAARRTDVGLRHVVVAAAAFGVTMLALAASPNLAVVFVLGLLLGGASIAFLTTSTAIVQLRAAPEMRGRVLALQAMVFLGSTPIGGPIVGWVCDAFGPRMGVALGGAATVVAAAYGWRASSRADRSAPSRRSQAAPVVAIQPVTSSSGPVSAT